MHTHFGVGDIEECLWLYYPPGITAQSWWADPEFREADLRMREQEGYDKEFASLVTEVVTSDTEFMGQVAKHLLNAEKGIIND